MGQPLRQYKGLAAITGKRWWLHFGGNLWYKAARFPAIVQPILLKINGKASRHGAMVRDAANSKP
jgi:hypothetical protein